MFDFALKSSCTRHTHSESLDCTACIHCNGLHVMPSRQTDPWGTGGRQADRVRAWRNFRKKMKMEQLKKSGPSEGESLNVE